MPGAGTDRTKEWIAGGPLVVLVEPQLGENIGAVARAMGNFGLSRLRIVNPRDGWPNAQAIRSASGADRILDEAVLFDTFPEAIADCTFVIAATARAHDQAKPVIGPDMAARELLPRVRSGEKVALVFGRERNGLENDEVALADRVLTLPINPAFASLNLAQAVVVVAYEWFKLAADGALPFTTPAKSEAASKEKIEAFFQTLVTELERNEFFRPPEKRDVMSVNLRNIILRLSPTEQDVQTLHGVVRALSEGSKGPATGGILRGEEAETLRALLNQHGAEGKSGTAPGRGLARLLRRNPTAAERALWKALTNDRRFVGHFKRNVPVGPHVADFLAQPLRLVLDLVPADEAEAASHTRQIKAEWFHARDYRIVEINSSDVELTLALTLDRIESAIKETFPTKP